MKTYVIALTTYREIVRRPLFWALTLLVSILIILFDVIPYYTLGEDIKMVKDQGLAVIKVCGLVIALFSASVAIAEELEGKTALTLLSKPVDRRSFIFGKFAGIMAAIALQFVLLTIVLIGALFYKVAYDAREYTKEKEPTLAECAQGVVDSFRTGAPMPQRVLQSIDIIPGAVLYYFEVMLLCAVSVALSTRFPVHLNITTCVIVFLLGHLAPQMVAAAEENKQFEAIKFMAQVFSTVLPPVEQLNIGPAISTEAQVPWLTYVLPCFGSCLLYTGIALLVGLLLFEDRDLA